MCPSRCHVHLDVATQAEINSQGLPDWAFQMQSSTSSVDSSGLSGGAVAGIIIGAVVFAALLAAGVAAVVLGLRRRHRLASAPPR